MKKLIVILLPLIVLLGFKADRAPGIHGTWDLVNLYEKAWPNEHPRPYIHLDAVASRVEGYDGCNEFAGDIDDLDESTIRFANLFNTEMLCATMPYQVVIDAMNQIRKYSFDGTSLNFYDESGKELLSFEPGALKD